MDTSEFEELYRREKERDTDEWKVTELKWQKWQLEDQKEETYKKCFILLVDEWIAWRMADPSDSYQQRSLRHYLNSRIRVLFESLRLRCNYIEDSDFLDFLRMLMPSTISAPIKMLNRDVIRYREEQCDEKREKYRKLLSGLCKNPTIPKEVILLISQFIPLLKFPSTMYSDTILVEDWWGKISNKIDWISLDVNI